jgi:chromosome segregation ATPase
MSFNQILENYGIPGLAMVAAISVIYLAAKALFGRSNSETKQDDMFNNLLTEINAERKASQERERVQQVSINHLSAELMNVKLVQATESGRNLEIKETMQRERDEWKLERAETAENIRTLQTEVLELQKNQRDNQAKIKEHEALIATLYQRIAEKDGEIATLNAMIAQLQAEKLQLMEQNTELGKQVIYHSARSDNLSQMLNPQPKTESPAIPLSDATQAIPDMSKVQDVDDTIHPLPAPTASGNADNPDNELKSALEKHHE